MKKIIFGAILTLHAIGISYAQNGINTVQPVTALDVNGDLNVTGKIRLKGTDTTPGDPGAKNKAFTSNGATDPASWEEVKIPLGYQGGMYLTDVEALFDKVGLELSATGATTYDENESLTGNWVEIPGLTKQVTILRPTNKVHVQFQTTAQINFAGTASYACGIFMENQLKGTRVDVVSGETGAYTVLNINASYTNLNPGTHTFKIACRGRTISSTTGKVAIGRSNVSGTLNDDMSQSYLNIYVLEDLID